MLSNARIESMGLLPYYIISYNKQGSFQMITKDYSKGPRVVRKDYVLWKVQIVLQFVSLGQVYLIKLNRTKNIL